MQTDAHGRVWFNKFGIEKTNSLIIAKELKMLRKILILATSVYMLSSCTQDEGLGGSCTIRGT